MKATELDPLMDDEQVNMPEPKLPENHINIMDLFKGFMLFIILLGCSCTPPQEIPATIHVNELGATFQTFKEHCPAGNRIIFGGWVSNPTRHEVAGNIVFVTEEGKEYTHVFMPAGSVGGAFAQEGQYFYENKEAVVDTVYFEKL